MPPNSMRDRHYDVLGVNPSASPDAIRLAYKQLALQWHPDRHRTNKEYAHKKFVEIKEAYSVLLGDSDQASKGEDREGGRTASPCPSYVPSSVPSEYGSEPARFQDPAGHRASGRHLQGRGRAPAPPPGFVSSSSSKSSDRNTSHVGRRSACLRVEREISLEQDDKFVNDYGKSGAAYEDYFDDVNVPDLCSPLRPLRMPHGPLVPDWVFPLPLTLEDLYYSTTHHYRITRTRRYGPPQLVKIDIKVSPSWRTGTRVRFASVGNQRGDGSFQDIVFVVREVPHPHFTRVGDDLHVTVHLPASPPSSLVRVRQTHVKHSVPDVVRVEEVLDDEVFIHTLDGEELALPIPRFAGQAANGARIVGGGMPTEHDGKHVGKGDLFVRWAFAPPSHTQRPRSPWNVLRKNVWKH